jgi:membrane protein implicated in regulation of membrane protease activity
LVSDHPATPKDAPPFPDGRYPLDMSPWVWWLIAAGGLAVAEMLTLDLTLILLAPAALAGAAVDLLGAPVAAQLIVFAVVAVIMLLFVRPVARRHLRSGKALRTGAAALIGETAQALSAVNADGGRIQLHGETWSARSWDGMEEIAEGERVEVVKIEGATALVRGGIA